MSKSSFSILFSAVFSLGIISAPSALIAHYKFDEAANATVAADSAGGNPGAIQSGVTTGSTGISGNAYSFDGSDDAFVDMGDASFIFSIVESGGSSLNNFSFSGWVN